jgi:ribose transport system substrate-binding protein
MKKWMSSLMYVILAVMVLSIAACGKSGKQEAPASAATNASASGEGNTATPGKKLKIGLTVQSLANPFFVAMQKGAQQAAQQFNAEVFVESGDYDIAKQTAQVENFISKKVDLILLNAVDSKGIAAAVQEAKAAGIPVVAVDVGADGGIDTAVTSDNYQAGVLAAEYLVKRLNGKGNVVVLDGPPVTSVFDRLKGFEDTIKKSTDIKVIATQNAEGSREKAVTMMENILQAHPKGQIQAVFGINDPTSLGAMVAVEQSGRAEEMFLVGVDGSPDAVEALKGKKSFAATSAQTPDAMVVKAVELGIKIINGEKVDELVKIPVQLVTTDNVNDYKGW